MVSQDRPPAVVAAQWTATVGHGGCGAIDDPLTAIALPPMVTRFCGLDVIDPPATACPTTATPAIYPLTIRIADACNVIVPPARRVIDPPARMVTFADTVASRELHSTLTLDGVTTSISPSGSIDT